MPSERKKMKTNTFYASSVYSGSFIFCAKTNFWNNCLGRAIFFSIQFSVTLRLDVFWGIRGIFLKHENTELAS